jgi:hypothetical protein
MTVSDSRSEKGLSSTLASTERRPRHLTDIRYKGVLHLAETCHYEKEHADQVTRLALQLYDRFVTYNLEDIDREYLEAVGFFIMSASSFPMRNIIDIPITLFNSEYLTGFTNHKLSYRPGSAISPQEYPETQTKSLRGSLQTTR